MTRSEQNFLSYLQDSDLRWQDATEGFKLQVFSKGKKKLDIEIGQVYDLYDWASLTKIVVGTPLVMRATWKKKLSLQHDPARELTWLPKNFFSISRLLSHSNGLTWWKPYYKKLVSIENQKWKPKYSYQTAWQEFEKIFRRDVLREIANRNISKNTKSVYSDLDLFLLATWLCADSQKRLPDILSEHLDRLNLASVHYCANNKPVSARTRYAPTELSPPRGGYMRGEVHDENTWSLSGLSVHAGLFGNINDLSRFGLKLRRSLQTDQPFLGIPSDWVQKFTRRALPRSRGDWAFGFMLPTRGSASCGKYFGLTSIGHTGFTGTSLWYDPRQDFLVTILSNRVHPTRKNGLFLKLRPLLHDWAYLATLR